MGSYRISGRSSAPPPRVFDVLADGAGWSRWAGPVVMRSWWAREGEPAPGGVGAIRALGTKWIGSREEIVAFDPPHHLAYTVLRGLPARHYRADVHITADGGGSRIEWAGEFEPVLAGTGWLLEAFLRWMIGGFTRRLAAYAARAA